MRALPPPEFVKIDPAAIEAALIARYEQKSGKTLYPAQVERLFIDQVAYAKSLALMAIQHAGEQLLVRFSGGVILEYLGELVATPRLLAQPARCTQSFTLAAPATAALLIDLGTRITSQDGGVVFATEQAATISVGATQVSVPVVCVSTGSLGNGWAIGQLATLEQPLAGLTTRNESVPLDGAEDEEDEAYSNAGSRGAYRYHVRGVHQSIIDVTVLGPDDGQEDGSVALYPLTASGLPSAELLAQVQTAVRNQSGTDHDIDAADRPLWVDCGPSRHAQSARSSQPNVSVKPGATLPCSFRAGRLTLKWCTDHCYDQRATFTRSTDKDFGWLSLR